MHLQSIALIILAGASIAFSIEAYQQVQAYNLGKQLFGGDYEGPTMSGTDFGTAVGTGIGCFVGGPAGYTTGAQIGQGVGQALDAGTQPKVNNPNPAPDPIPPPVIPEYFDPMPQIDYLSPDIKCSMYGGPECVPTWSNPLPEPESKTYSVPSHVQTSGGSKWSNNPGDPSTWSIVPMTDPDHRGQYKVIDDDGKNVAANFVSHEEAQDYING